MVGPPVDTLQAESTMKFFDQKWICPNKQVYQKFGIKNLVSNAPLIFQAKTIEITHIANWSKCRTANMIATWLDRSLVRARIHWGLHGHTSRRASWQHSCKFNQSVISQSCLYFCCIVISQSCFYFCCSFKFNQSAMLLSLFLG